VKFTTEGSFLKRWQRPLIVTGVCVVLGATVISMTMAHWWKVYRGATVTSAGKVRSDASVYASRDDQFVLVYLKEGEELYLINLPTQQISMPNRSTFLILPGLVFSRHFPPVGVQMGKAEVDPQLVISNQSVEFTSVNRSRIRLNLSG
jgi:hypothetical protein